MRDHAVCATTGAGTTSPPEYAAARSAQASRTRPPGRGQERARVAPRLHVRPNPVVPDDRELLRRFLNGELPEDQIDALEVRLDAEPELQRKLRALAQEVFTGEVPEHGTTRISLLARSAALPPTPPIAQGLELREVIGEGGMGVVHRARQNSLGRTVAVKTVREGRHEAPLIQEAVLTGYLEHPNIVPIHDIAVAEGGEPIVVMKHIEGRSWRSHLGVSEETEPHNLEWHIGVVMQVCQALRFAHSRGVIHRDVKPDNVMLGEFDEVYLLDWGLAVSLEDGSRLPCLREQRGVAGTPAYMAPEQLAEDAPRGVGVHTDIYQLGACLYHAAVGEPPQEGTTLDEIRDQIHEREELTLPDQVPADLGGIIGRAMAMAPSERFASAGELRKALESYLEHRASNALMVAGHKSAQAMLEHDQAENLIGAERAFFEAAFNYRAALDSWPQNRIARRRLNRVVRQRVTQLIARDAPLAARRALALVDIDDPELHQMVDDAVAKQVEARARLRDYERGDNRILGLETRRLMGLVLGGIWIALNVAMVALPVTSSVPLLFGAVVCLAITVAAIVRARRVMLEVRLNRYNGGIATVAQMVHCLLLFGAVLQDRPAPKVLIELLLFWSLASGATAVVVDRRIGFTSAGYALGYVLCQLDPSWLTYVLPATATLMVVVSTAINVATARAAEDDVGGDRHALDDPTTKS